MGIGGVDGRYNGQEIQKSNINVVVVVNTHGYYNQIGYGLNEQSTTIEEIKNKLKEKSVKGVVLGGCNQGHVSHVSDNIASFFSKISNGAYVFASDGSVQVIVDDKGKVKFEIDSKIDFEVWFKGVNDWYDIYKLIYTD